MTTRSPSAVRLALDDGVDECLVIVHSEPNRRKHGFPSTVTNRSHTFRAVAAGQEFPPEFPLGSTLAPMGICIRPRAFANSHPAEL